MDGGLIMADTVKVPGIGPVKKPWLYAGIGITAGILIWAYYRRSSGGGGSAAPAAAADAGLTDPYSQGSDASGYNMIYPPGSSSGDYSPYGYDIYGNPLPAPTGLGGGAITTNSDWASAAESTLQDSGVSLSVATTAITRVLGGLSVTSVQRDYFMQAVGTLGQPPQGYPTPIHVTDPGTEPNPPQGGTGSTPSGASLPAPGNLHAASVGRTTVRIEWSPVKGAKGYTVYDVADPAGGGTPTGRKQQSVVYTNYNKAGLRPGTRYRFDVHALGADNKIGARARVYVTTKK